MAADSVRRAAELMRNIGIGCIPVVNMDHRILIGVITDRDIVTRCVAEGHAPSCAVRSHMTSWPLETVEPDADVSEVIEKMERTQVRRIPVVDERTKLVGIIAQADIARKLGPAQPRLVDEVLEKVSGPGAR